MVADKGSEDLTHFGVKITHSQLWLRPEDYGQSPADVKLVTEAGTLAVSRFMQVMGPRMMSMGRTQEKMLLKMFEEKAVVSKMESLLKEKEDIVSSLTATIETKEYESNVFKNRMENLEKQLNEQRVLFESKVAGLEVDLKEKIEQGYEMVCSRI
ncbi:hypothetical protein PIB30_081810 [Stylosanthes scabra]|uniref:Uncharacterized protein n=1 Tax=Stylosanthes scabra TaxID=79078 RepID=A0ABU6QRF4_9FABA|nr:hypothetical protein [Stylosanthes scabra]